MSIILLTVHIKSKVSQKEEKMLEITIKLDDGSVDKKVYKIFKKDGRYVMVNDDFEDLNGSSIDLEYQTGVPGLSIEGNNISADNVEALMSVITQRYIQ